MKRQGSAVFRDVDGNTVQVETYRYFDVHLNKCQPVAGGQPPYHQICAHEYVRFYAPVEVEGSGGRLIVTPNLWDPQRKRQLEFSNVEYVRLVEPSASRPVIITGVAIAAALAAGAGTFALTRDRLHPLGTLWLSSAAFGAAGGLSLVITVPLTRGLGEVH